MPVYVGMFVCVYVYMCVYACVCVCVCVYFYESGLYSLSDEILSVAHDFFDQWDPSTTTPMEEVRGLKGGTMLKNSPILLESAYELFRRPNTEVLLRRSYCY